MPETPSPIAYLTGEYPAVSHTFILREILALREEGRDVLTCSIRKTNGQNIAGEQEGSEAARTFYVIESIKDVGILLGALRFSFGRPRSLSRTFRLAVRTSAPGLKQRIWQFFYFCEAMVLAHHLNKHGVVHLHNHFANSSCTVAMLASELSGIPFSFTLHGPAIFFEPGKWRIDEKIARAKFVACISHFCRSQGMIFADPAHWKKMNIVHCGVQVSRYAKSTHGQGQRILFVGRLAAVKGVAVLLNAMLKVKMQFPDVRLTLIGDGIEREKLEELVRSLSLNESVEFLGSRTQPEVIEALKETDIFVLPSFAEGVPVVLMEAMASNLPVVATRIAGIPELVEADSGSLVPPGSSSELAEAILEILADTKLQDKMGSAGRRKILESFDITKEASKLGRLIDE